MIINWDDTDNKAYGTGIAGDIDRFIATLPGLQYTAADFEGKTAKDTAKRIFNMFKSGGITPIVKSSIMLCGIASHFCKKADMKKLAGFTSFLQNCAAIYTIGNTISDHIKFQWTQRDYIYLCATKATNSEIHYPTSTIRNKNICHATQFCGVSFVECNALVKFVNEGQEMSFYSSLDHKQHTIKPIMTNIETVTMQKSGDEDSSEKQSCILKPSYVGNSAAILAWQYDDLDVVMTNSFTPAKNGENRVCNISDTWESILVANNGAKLQSKITEYLVEFISALFAKYLDTENYIYRLTSSDDTVAAELRPTILPPKLISPSVENTINAIETIFEKNMARSYSFVGFPGTGKTIITQQISSRFPKVCTFKLNPEVVNDDRAMSGLLTYIKAVKKCIIIIDDLDSADLSKKNELVNSFIEFFDKLNTAVKNDGVSFVFLTTINDPSKVNSTIMRRSGRIDETIEIGYPHPEIIDYLLEYSDRGINNGEQSFDYKSDEFKPAMEELYNAHFSAADINNLMTDITVSSSDGKITPQLMIDAIKRIKFRNEASTKNYLDADPTDGDEDTSSEND